jgi:hypothetical protein
MKKFWDTAKKWAGIDFHIFATLLMRMWTVVAGGVMIIGIPHWFSQLEQGYYFTFYSLLGLQVFFELGFNYVVIQQVGHEIVHLRQQGDGTFAGDAFYLDRLTSLIELLRRWYLRIAILFFIVVGAAGAVFFQVTGSPDVQGWLSGWVLLVMFSAANLYLSPFLAVAEGAGKVGQVARLRLYQSIVGYGGLWLLLTAGAGLWAVPIVSGAACVGTAYWLNRHGVFLRQLARREVTDHSNRVDWRREILPFQWRIAVSWISGYLIFQLFNPMLFALQGPVQAGRAGMALTIFSTILSVAMSWLTAKTPVIAGHLAKGEQTEALRLFAGLVWRSAIFNFLGCAAVVTGVWILSWLHYPLASRIADIPSLLCLLVVNVANHAIFSMATFMRAHKKEPLMWSSVVVGACCVAAVYIGGHFSIFTTLGAYAAVTVIVGLPWCVAIFRSFVPAGMYIFSRTKPV